jgi:hypothetical protein
MKFLEMYLFNNEGRPTLLKRYLEMFGFVRWNQYPKLFYTMLRAEVYSLGCPDLTTEALRTQRFTEVFNKLLFSVLPQ